MPNADPQISAYVLLKPGSDARDVIPAFVRHGFSVGQEDPRGFSIAGRKSLFERFFQRSFGVVERGGVHMFGPGTPPEFPLQALPRDVQGHVERIVTTTADFGPGSF